MNFHPRLVMIPVALLCFAVIGYILIKENILNKNSDKNPVLGISTESMPRSMFGFFNSVVDSTIGNSKEKLSSKAADVEKSVMSTVETEAKNLADSQVRALKYQICSNWGIISSTPSGNP